MPIDTMIEAVQLSIAELKTRRLELDLSSNEAWQLHNRILALEGVVTLLCNISTARSVFANLFQA